LLNVIGTVLILAMVLAVNADVGGRNLFNNPIPGVLEFVALSVVAVVFLQMANTLREDRHVSNDIVVSLIVSSHPRWLPGCIRFSI
jgi:TRAP-type C4-dicarboxylate transport system permease small subunit